jgi:hypothetical protein
MTRAPLVAIAILVVGVVIVLYSLSTDGALISFTALLGLLCIADGVLRLLSLGHKER